MAKLVASRVAATLLVLLMFYGVLAFAINFGKFVQQDFQEPWKPEIIHGLGVAVPPLSMVTMWM